MNDQVLLLTADPGYSTYPWREEIKALGGWWYRERKGWLVPLEAGERAEQFVSRVPGLRAERIDTPPPPRVLLVTGPTYPSRQDLAALGGRWNKWRNGWIVPLEFRGEIEALARDRGLGVEEVVVGGGPTPSRATPTTPASGVAVTTPHPALRASSPGNWLIVQHIAGHGFTAVRELQPSYLRVAQDQVLADVTRAARQLAVLDHTGQIIAASPHWPTPAAPEQPTSPPAAGIPVSKTDMGTPEAASAATSAVDGGASPQKRRAARKERPAAQVTAQSTPAPDGAEITAGMRALVDEITRWIESGRAIDNPTLSELATEAYGGSRGQGAYTPREAYDALEVAVNRWVLRHGPRLVAMAPKEALAELEQLVARLPRQADRTHEQVEYQQFSTPPTHAFVVACALGVQPGQEVLEPSAGVGSLAAWATAMGGRVHTNEIAPRRQALLRELGWQPTSCDAELLHDLLPDHIQPTAVLMNPPFTSSGDQQGKRHSNDVSARHVEQALERLQPGGRLVAILGRGMALDRPTAQAWWERIASRYNLRANIGLPGRLYGKYGTTFDNQLVVVDHTGPTPGDGFAERLEHVRWDDVESLNEALDVVEALGRPAERTKRAEGAPSPESIKVEATDAMSPSVQVSREMVAEEDSAAYVLYRPVRLDGQQLAPHPARIVETATMAAVDPPEIQYQSALPEEIIRGGRLSAVQYEAVLYAGQRHQQLLPDGARGGFFLGDGTGVGKGRTIAGAILDNWYQGRQRALWVSVSNDLLEAATRDLRDLGVPDGEIPLVRLQDVAPPDGEIDLPRGIVFTTYSTLARASVQGRGLRREQLERWLGEDGVIVFDEAHRAKNAMPSGRGEPTKTGQAVLDIQANLPGARVLYVSATGATDTRNMAYMTRLGLWGAGTAFPGGFTHFLAEIENGGLGAMEMVARDLKALGLYLSRSISYRGVEFCEVLHEPTREQVQIFNTAAEAWQIALANVKEALKVTQANSASRTFAMQHFWGAEQRFFKQLTTAIKVPTAIRETERALAAGQSVVLGLIGTGESATEAKVSKALADEGDLDGLDFTPREILAGFIARCFPTVAHRETKDPTTRKVIRVPVRDEHGNFVHSKKALAIKERLLDRLSDLSLPDNPLDQIINQFGVDQVAELTGREKRLLRDAKGHTEYRKRAPTGVAMSRTNLHEMAEFQSGRKRIAIISNAASTGISLHASNREDNRQQRVHITLETGWSADQQLQQFGRTHRSDQAVPPKYVLLASTIGGEKRFMATIARRLGSLGALTKGQRDAASAGSLEHYNFETPEGAAAVDALLARMQRGLEIPGLDNPAQVLRDMALLSEDNQIKPEDRRDVTRFLNRLLALDIERQNATFDAFAEMFEGIVEHAKAAGTFDRGVEDIRGVEIRLLETSPVHTHEATGALTTHYVIEVDHEIKVVSWEEVEKQAREHAPSGGGFFKQERSGRIVYAAPATNRTNPASGLIERRVSLSTPRHQSASVVEEWEFAEKYKAVDIAAAREWWEAAVAKLPKVETERVHILGGAILPLWERLKTASAQQLAPVRVTTTAGQRIVGVQIPQEQVGRVLEAIGLSRSCRSAEDVWRAVLLEGGTVALVAGFGLKRSSVHSDPRVEVTGFSSYHFGALREMGLIEEYIDFRRRFFVPITEDDMQPPEALGKLLDRYPAAGQEPTPPKHDGLARLAPPSSVRGELSAERPSAPCR